MSSSAQATTFYLPNSLLLLVHLHLLEYPYSNCPEYDHNIFNPRIRGLRERARTMEDVTYYLIGKIEGKGVKNILSTYPCNQPAESLAFRTTLTKYLENLRHQCIYPASSRPSTSSGPSSKLKLSNEHVDTSNQAWWWKDIVVRKSLLEECSGEKFERLMLSLSTHTLMRTTHALSQVMMSTLLRSQPTIYSTSLAQYQTNRHAWEKSASLLTNSQADLEILRDRIQSTVKSSKYDSMPTDRVKALANSSLQELLQRQWTGAKGKAALHFVIDLVALKLSSTSPLCSAHVQVNTSTVAPVVPSPLPTAAAHHPAHLKRLRRPVFNAKSKVLTESGDVPHVPLRSHAEIIIAEHLASQKRTHQTLIDALSRLKKRGLELRQMLDAVTTACSSGNSPPLEFWTHSQEPTTSIDFTPKVTRDSMISLGFQAEFEALDQDTMDEDALEKKIEEIRQTVLPPYPSVPDLSTPRLPPRDFTPIGSNITNIPKAKTLQNQLMASTSSQIPISASINNLPMTTPGIPAPPAMSPGKSSRSMRRQSVRFSMAIRQTTRPSMFRVFSGQVNDEVDKLVDETHDFPTDDEDTGNEHPSPYKTPRGKAKQKINRILTAGTPMSAKRSTAKPGMSSSPAFSLSLDGGPKQRLPSLMLSISSASSTEADEENIQSEDDDGFRAGDTKDVDATPRPRRQTLPLRSSAVFLPTEEEDVDSEDAEAFEQDVFGDDPPSMTLKEILLSADTSYFDLLEAGNDDVDEGMLTADASFVWE